MSASIIKFLKGLNPDFVKLLTGSGLVFAVRVLGALAGYVLAYVITTNYGAQTFGVFELCLTILTILSVLGRLGLDGALVRFIPEYVEKRQFNHLRSVYKIALSVAMPISLVFATGLFFGAEYLAKFFKSEALVDGFQITALIVPFSTWMGLNTEAFRGMKKMVSYSFYQRGTVVFIATIAILILAFNLPYSNQVPLMGFGIGVVGLSIAAGVYAPRQILDLGEAQTTTNTFLPQTLLTVAFPMLLSTSMFMVMNWTDTLMIGYYLEESEVGIYRLAFKIAALTTFAQFAINSIAAPMFSSFNANGDMKGLRKIVRNIGYLNVLISVPIFIIIILFPKFLLNFFGDEFTTGVAPLIILAIGSVINAICGPVMYLLNMTGKEKIARNIIIIASILNIILNLTLIPIFGLLGAAYATSISTVVWNALGVAQIKKEYGFISIPHPF
ncbi:MAG: hypothetical protein CL847_00310 [Crocinitomicaceae bacterium]|nr:hypothetical protein [Crocinitomicaceae bacterium]|tara:strand:+ start:4111 stop:5439 length:1329 start_codon:yes stop_codon:yes gene_type:complete